MNGIQWPEGMGVYRVYDPKSNEAYVGYSRNLRGTYKRLRFELKLNACSYKQLQAFYNERAGEVAFEPLELFTPPEGISEEETDARLFAMLYRHKANLHAKIIQTTAG